MVVTSNIIIGAMHGLSHVWVSDRKLVSAIPGARHLRGGKITKGFHSRLAGTPVHAVGFDELGNMIHLGMDGHIRQETDS